MGEISIRLSGSFLLNKAHDVEFSKFDAFPDESEVRGTFVVEQGDFRPFAAVPVRPFNDGRR